MNQRITVPPASTVEARQKQLLMGYRPTYGRGSAGGSSPLPHGASWMPHTGNRQKMRVLERAWSRFEKDCKRDEYAQTTRERLLDWLASSQLPGGTVDEAEFAAKVVVLNAQLDGGNEYVTFINKALNSAEQEADAKLMGSEDLP